MDYGKLAYLKVDELESRLAPELATERTKCYDYTVKPVYDFRRGDYFITDATASGAVTVFVRACVRADSSVENGLFELKINGFTAGRCDFSASAGETRDCFVMSAASVDGSAELAVSMNGLDCTLLSCQILLSGSNADLCRSGGDAAVDKCGSVWALVSVSDDNIYAYTFGEEDFSLGQPVRIGSGRRADVCAGVDGFAAAYVDSAGNTFVAKTDVNLNVLSRIFVDAGADSVAITRRGEGFLLAQLKNNVVSCRFIDAAGGYSMPTEITRDDKAVSVGFVKNAEPPMLIVTTGERSYLKPGETELGGGDRISLAADIDLTAVTEVQSNG